MSDQYTRISLGGSPLSPPPQQRFTGTTTSSTNPNDVVGLLFGTFHLSTIEQDQVATSTSSSSNTQMILSVNITDADDIPIDCSEVAAKQIELHQAVFTNHQVIGWYRVVDVATTTTEDNTGGPTLSDLVITKQLKAQYSNNSNTKIATAGSSNSGNEENTTTSQPQPPFLFALLQVHQNQEHGQQKIKSEGVDVEEEVEDDELPFTLFQLIGSSDKATNNDDSAVLVAIEGDWKLDTAVAERIAVERVLRDQHGQKYKQQQQTTTIAATTSTSNVASQQQQESGDQGLTNAIMEQHTSEIQHSVSVVKQRMKCIEQYVQDTIKGNVPYHPQLIRRISCLILYQNGLLAALSSDTSTPKTESKLESAEAPQSRTTSSNTPTSIATSDMIHQLTVLATAIDTIQSYTEKVRIVHEEKLRQQQQQQQQSQRQHHYNRGPGFYHQPQGGGGGGSGSNIPYPMRF